MLRPGQRRANRSIIIGQTLALRNAAIRSWTDPEARRFGVGRVQVLPITGKVPHFRDDNMGHSAIISRNGTIAVGGGTTATESFSLPSIRNRSHSSLIRAIGIRAGDIILTLIIPTMVRSTATMICRRTRWSQMSRPNCTTRVITTALSMVSSARIRKRQSRITRPTTDSQSPLQLMSRQLLHSALANRKIKK